ncbi:hypothetical protein CVD25_01070 [Bacillus canaveralius]|uniref:Uncharacterized protein n=1 Tax=Bacillus canaveralius TaxID=1403243 RepID=A0A2N5GPL4_9BACI|nr:hypothetical protein [Bacillus canaveralius]PLR84655.1 hypothetical protein CU635_06180 [Bacillus canaveralius]PLS00807.1 hypothetical protein CVD25_01070 [Bacillus canaveralius]
MPDFFEPSTPVDASPEGQEVETAEDAQDQEEEILDDEQEIQEELESAEEDDEEELPPGEEEQPGQEELIAGKFKSQGDLINAYKSLERTFHQSRQQQNQQYQQPQPPYQQQQPQRDINEVFWEEFNQNPFATMQHFVNALVENQTAPIYQQQADSRVATDIDGLAKEYPQITNEQGMQSLIDKVYEIAEYDFGNSALASQPSKRLLKMAAQELFGESKTQAYQQGKQQGKRQAEQARRAKQGLASTRTTKPKQTEKTPEELIAESIVNAGSRGGLFG